MSFLIDTNIISEVRKGERCDPYVSAWYASIADEDLFLSTLVLGELRKGVELARPRDPDKAAALERWLRQVEAGFDGRVLGIDNAVSDQWGRMSAIRPIPVIDGLLAATAVTNGLTLVTRKDRDIAGLGAMLLNPFRIAQNHRRS
ncbi:type II toxin-antitoxin system VapC family toxin [Bradyrhizobium sp.]|uniref:type II toxin-antitoxin system VapC family toxin n=1 Tax=Bradyrhizobium sp. TaxID=376 RepID=UPI000A715141|nr:type II toxin-antitoxin system VapC family toxin [Bradyrhizobium sp.]